jgi:hypothetical protein
MKGESMYKVYVHARKEECADAGDALSRAVMCAVQGREASVVGENGEMIWFIEVDTKPLQNSTYCPAIVHFRGASLEQITGFPVQEFPF